MDPTEIIDNARQAAIALSDRYEDSRDCLVEATYMLGTLLVAIATAAGKDPQQLLDKTKLSLTLAVAHMEMEVAAMDMPPSDEVH